MDRPHDAHDAQDQSQLVYDINESKLVTWAGRDKALKIGIIPGPTRILQDSSMASAPNACDQLSWHQFELVETDPDRSRLHPLGVRIDWHGQAEMSHGRSESFQDQTLSQITSPPRILSSSTAVPTASTTTRAAPPPPPPPSHAMTHHCMPRPNANLCDLCSLTAHVTYPTGR